MATVNTPGFLGIVVGSALGASLALVVALCAGWRPVTAGCPSARDAARSGRAAHRGAGRTRTLAAVGAFLAAIVLTRWPVAAIAAGAGVLVWPRIFGGARIGAERIERLEALAKWTESLRDTIAGAVGLEQALDHSVDVASASIRPALVRLQGQMRARVPLQVALDGLANDLDDRSADLVVAAFKLSAQLRGEGLGAALTALAESTRQELELRRHIEEGRKKIRRTARHMITIAAVIAAAMALGARQYVEPYRSTTGQVVLLIVLGLIAAGLAWLRSASVLREPARILAHPRAEVRP